MNKNDASILDAAGLVDLRKSLYDNLYATQIIAERLGVKQMGPADFIRTKREVQTFLRTGTLADAAKIVENVRARLAWKEAQSQTLSQRQGQQMSQ